MTIIDNFEKRLDELAPSSSSTLSKAIRYALFGGGKRLRPQLLFATIETFNCDPLIGLDPACAIEMIHTYSLIHDDLPCMDDDDFRRNRPTVHRFFSEAIAILSGDALLTEAFRTLSQAPSLTPFQIIRLINTLSTRSGKDGMVEGQAIDILSTTTKISSDLLIQMGEKKTGDLFSASLESGAIIANASANEEEILRKVGLQFGLAYQILDDLEDESTNSSETTFVSILGTASCIQMLKQTIKEIEDALTFLPSNGQPIKSIIHRMIRDRPKINAAVCQEKNRQ